MRALARSLPAGHYVTATELAEKIGCDSNTIHTLARTFGIHHMTQDIEILKSNEVLNYTGEYAYAKSHVMERLESISRDKRSTLTESDLASLAELGEYVTVRQVCDSMLGTEHTTNQRVAMRVRLRGVEKAALLERKVMVPTVGITRKVKVYPASEFISAWADSIESRGPAPVESLMTTEEMLARVRVDSKNAANYAVRVTDPIQSDDATLPIDPYLFGYWLGDGTSRSSSITVGASDLAFAQGQLATKGFSMKVLQTPDGNYQLRFGRPDGWGCKYGHRLDDEGGACPVCPRMRRCDHQALVPVNASMGEELIRLGVKGNKRIPARYLRASYIQRLGVLQGLMDSDGTVSRAGAAELCLTNRDLALDALELIRSLGIKARIATSDATISEVVDGERVRRVVGSRHRIHFTTEQPVFVMPRKRMRLPVTTRATQGWVYIEDIEVGDPVPMRCLAVEHPSGMYLTDGFIPTHNSILTRSLFGWSSADRVRPSGLPGSTGSRNTLIAFESKGQGISHYAAWSQATGDELWQVDMADADSLGIDMFAGPGGVGERADAFVNALKAAFEHGSIQAKSLDELRKAYTAALAIVETPGLPAMFAEQHPTLIHPDASVNHFALVLLGGKGDDVASAVASELIARGGHTDPAIATPQMREATASLMGWYSSGQTARSRINDLQAPRNKVSQLATLEQWWSPRRKKVSWDQVLEARDVHRAIVVNTGASLTGNRVEAEMTGIMSSLLMTLLQQAIERNCMTWFAENRSVSIFADELKLLAEHSSDTVKWIKDQGREFGVRACFATQRPAQLDQSLRSLFFQFSTAICFTQEDVATSEEVARQFGSGVSAEEIMHLSGEHRQVLVRSYANGTRQDPYTTRMLQAAETQEEKVAFLVAQGFDLEAPTAQAGAPGPVSYDAQPAVPAPVEPVPVQDSGYFGDPVTDIPDFPATEPAPAIPPVPTTPMPLFDDAPVHPAPAPDLDGSGVWASAGDSSTLTDLASVFDEPNPRRKKWGRK